MRWIYIIAASAVLSACDSTSGDILSGAGSPAWFAMASPETIASYYGRQCRAYGFQDGTQEMAVCIQNSAQAGRQSADQRLAQGSAYFQRQQAINAAQQPQVVNTRCNRLGNTVNCTSY